MIEIILFIIFIIIYLVILIGLLYLSYVYIKYINDMEKKGCKCSEDIKRDMVKNFSYIILGSWALLIISFLVTTPKELLKILDVKFLNINIIKIINFIIIGGYGLLLFTYSKKLINESCKCSESWVRETMQYQSYIYISLSVVSFFLILIKMLIGNDKKEIYKLLNAYRKNNFIK
tara:strand:+ start:6598 stop:7122 length:525 start_codon:yes stop_codon:yes gene_type:complete